MQLDIHLKFDIDCNQDVRDATDGGCPVATVTVGSPRTLAFRIAVRTVERNSWVTFPTTNSRVHHKYGRVEQFAHGSVWVLSLEDEIPKRVGDHYYKMKHGDTMEADGVSMAFVFRKIKDSSTAYFCRSTNNLVWKRTDCHYNILMRATIREQYQKYAKRKERPKYANRKESASRRSGGEYLHSWTRKNIVPR